MKKTYNQPECIVVQLDTCRMMAESLAINRSEETINNTNDILVKKQTTPSVVNVWDDEW